MLVVDDDPQMLGYVQRLLQEAGDRHHPGAADHRHHRHGAGVGCQRDGEGGVKRLSEVNLLLALLLLAFVLTVGPTRDIATDTVTSLGQYLATIGPLSNWVGREDLDFMHGWTIFFWAWWISWSPFVGLADVLARKRSRPTARGKNPDANFVRNRAIVDAVQWLVQQGLRATRSKAMAVASVEGGSACDAGRRQS